MRTLKTINADINRCQLQIVAIYKLPESEQLLTENQTILEGFQMALKKLYNEQQQAINQFRVGGAKVVLPNGPESIAVQYGSSFHERAFQTCNFSIQQLNASTR